MEENFNNRYTIDASFVLSFLLPDEKKSPSENYFSLYASGKLKFISSPLLTYEVLNALRSACLSKRIAKEKAIKLGLAFLKLHIENFEPEKIEILKLALKNNITVYDASYVEAAKQTKTKLLSLDKKLLRL